jgi:hypothetical protein
MAHPPWAGHNAHVPDGSRNGGVVDRDGRLYMPHLNLYVVQVADGLTPQRGTLIPR